jgi:hypothetical protein
MMEKKERLHESLVSSIRVTSQGFSSFFPEPTSEHSLQKEAKWNLRVEVDKFEKKRDCYNKTQGKSQVMRLHDNRERGRLKMVLLTVVILVLHY